jgi:hypothetical protein
MYGPLFTLSILVRNSFISFSTHVLVPDYFGWGFTTFCTVSSKKLKKKLHGLSPRVNYTDRATAACRRSDCQLLRIEGATWSA